MSDIHFNHSLTIWHALAYLLLTATLLYWEYKKGKSWIRFMVSALLTFSLLMIYVRPYIIAPKPLQSIVLIGEGVDSSLADSLIAQQKYPVFKLKTDSISTMNSFLWHDKNRTITLSNWEKQTDTIFSVGYISHMPMHFNHWEALISKAPYALDFTRQIKLGDTLRVAISNTSGHPIVASLAVDSELPTEKRLLIGENLAVAFKKKVSGNYQTRIQINDEAVYQVNTLVAENESLSVCLLAGTPDFEWKFLNNFLGSKGHRIFWKTEVSNDLFKEQTTNWPDSMNSNVMKSRFSNYNLVICDVQAWDSLPYVQQKELIEAVKNSNVSFILRANEGTALKDKTGLLPLEVNSGQSARSTQLKAVHIRNSADWIKYNEYQYLSNELGRRIGLISLQNSFIWLLEGQKEVYEKFWDAFMHELLVSDQSEFYFHEPLAFAGHPYNISKWAASHINDLRIIAPQGDTILLAANNQAIMGERKVFTFFPSSIGWHSIIVANKPNIPFYAHPIQMAKEALGQNAYQFNYHQALDQLSGNVTITSPLNNERDISLWFFVILIACLAYLWIEEKLN